MPRKQFYNTKKSDKSLPLLFSLIEAVFKVGFFILVLALESFQKIILYLYNKYQNRNK